MTSASGMDVVVALLEQLRNEKAAIEQDIAVLEQALAVAERRPLAPRETSTMPLSPQAPLVPDTFAPAPLTRRSVPRLPSSAERLSDDRIRTLAQEVRGMKQAEALEHLGQEVGDFQNADAVKLLITAGLTTGKRSNVSSHTYRYLTESGRFEKVGPGRFRLIARASQEPVTQDIPTGDQQEGTAPSPVFAENREDTTV